MLRAFFDATWRWRLRAMARPIEPRPYCCYVSLVGFVYGGFAAYPADLRHLVCRLSLVCVQVD